MPVGSSRTPEGVSIPDEYDLTIVSTSDEEAVIRHAIDADDFPTVEDEEDAGDGDSADTDEDAGDEDDADAEDASAGGHASAAPAGAAAAAAAPAIDGDYEPPRAGESRADKEARLDRNTQRIQKLVTTQTQQLSTLTTENARLRATIEGRGESTRREGDAGAAGERPTPPAQKFAFPSREDYYKANPDATEDDYVIALTDARYAHNRAQEQASVDAQRRQEASTRLKTETDRHIAAVKQDLTDWDVVVRNSESPMTDTMHLTMLKQGELGPRLVYWLSQPANLAEAQRIAALEPLDQVAAILDLRDTVRPKGQAQAAAGNGNGAGKAAAGTNGARAAAADAAAIVQPSSRRKASAAPAPLKPVPGEARNAPSLAELDTDAYVDRMDEQDRRRGRRK